MCNARNVDAKDKGALSRGACAVGDVRGVRGARVARGARGFDVAVYNSPDAAVPRTLNLR